MTKCFELALYAEQQKQRLDNWNKRYSRPAFSVFSAITTGAYNGAKVYNHDLEPLSKSEGDGSHVYRSEFASVAAGLRQTNAYSGTSSVVASMTCLNGHLGHSIVQVDEEGAVRYNSKDNVDAHRFVGTWTNSTRPDLALFIDGDTLWIGNRNMATSKDGRWGALTGGLPGMDAYANGGSIGFNELTGQLAVLEPSSDGTQFRLATWENLSPPQNFKTSEDFFQQDGITSALRIETAFFSTPVTNPAYTECKTRAVVTVCDNGTIVISKMFPHHNFTTFVIEKTGGSYVVPTTNKWASNYSTTYGCEQGALYGIRHRVTLDGKYTIAFAPNYYYGTGIRASITRVSDGKVLSFMHNGANYYGFSPVPVLESDFLLFYSQNTDGGVGTSYFKLDVPKRFETLNDGDTIPVVSPIQHRIDSPYYSTNYPAIIPMIGDNEKLFTREGYMS